MKRIAEHIYLLNGERNGRFPFSHSLFIKDRLNVLIDAGCGAKTLKEVHETLRPDRIIYSHAHPDHCLGCGTFSSSKVWGPRERSESTGDPEAMSRRFIQEDLRRAWITFWVECRGFVPFRAGNFFEDGHVFDFGTTRMEAVHAPGHCDNHYGFYFPGQRILFTTDIDFTAFGPWYGNEESNIDGFMASVRRLQAYEVRAVVSSHAGLITRGIREAFDGFLEVFEYRDRAILDFLSRPRSLDDFVDRALIYRRYPDRPEILRFWERQMISKHLRRLLSRKMVFEQQGRFMLRT